MDLYVCAKAFLSTHTGSEALFTAILDAYTDASPRAKEVVAQLARVRARGRKKLAFG